MSARVQGYRVKEPRVLAGSSLSSQRRSNNNSMSSLAQAWATFGEAKSALEKLDSSPPIRSSHSIITSSSSRVPPTTVTTPTTSREGLTDSTSVLGRRGQGLKSSGDGVEESSRSHLLGSQKTSHRTRERSKKRKDINPLTTDNNTSIHHGHTSYANTKAIFGPPISFNSAPSSSSHLKTSSTPSATPGDNHNVPPVTSEPTTAPRSSTGRATKINLAEDTLAMLRSKVEAQKQALESTNSRLQVLRQPSPVVTSEPCIYPLPEVTRSFSSTSNLPTMTTSHNIVDGRASHKISSTGVSSRLTRGATSQTLTNEPRHKKVKVRKIGYVSSPVDPLRSRHHKTLHHTTSSLPPPSVTESRRQRMKEYPPHTRSWALRPSATSMMTMADKTGTALNTQSVGVGDDDGVEGSGVVKLRDDLSQMLQDLESSRSSDEEEEREIKPRKQPQSPSSSSSMFKKRRLIMNPENRPLPQPPQTKPYNHEDVQRYIREKQRERRLAAHREQEELERQRKEREERQRELVQRQRRIVQANLRSRQRTKLERSRESLKTGLESELTPLLTITSPYSTYHQQHTSLLHTTSPPRPPSHIPTRQYTSSLSSHHTSPQSTTSQHSPHTYTISPHHSKTTEHHSGTSLPCHEEPLPTTLDKQSSHEERILALTQSALELKRKIAAEAERLKQNHSKTPGNVTSSQPHVPPVNIPPRVTLPGVQSVHRHALLAEEAKREGDAAIKIQAMYRGHYVRKTLQWQLPSGTTLRGSLGRMGDGEEDVNTGINGVLKTSSVLKTTPDVLKLATPCQQSVGVQTPHISSLSPTNTTTTAGGTDHHEVCPLSLKEATPPWKKGGGDPLSVINIFAREKGNLQHTISQLKSQKISELKQLQTMPTSITSSPDHTHTVSHTSSVEKGDSYNQHSISFPSPSISSSSTKSEQSPTTTHHELTPPTTTPTTTHYSTSCTTSNGVHNDEDIPAITPPGSPSFVSSFTADITPVKPLTSHSPNTPISDNSTIKNTSGGPTGGRLSPRSLSLKLQAELSLLETIEESMRQLSVVEGSRAVSTARQETMSLAQLLERQRVAHEKEVSSVRAAEEERVREMAMAREEEARAELERVKRETEEREKRVTNLEYEITHKSQQASQQLANARELASNAVISSAKLQVEAAHNMAVSVATAAAREAVTAAMASIPSHPIPPDHTHHTTTSDKTYTSDFEESFQPDSLAGDNVSQLVPTASATSSGDNTLTPVHSVSEVEHEKLSGDETTVPEEEEMDGDTTVKEEASFRELLPSVSHCRQRSHRLSLSESESRLSSPTHSLPHTPSSYLPGDDQSASVVRGEDSFFQFMSRMMEQYMKEEEMRSRHRALLLQLREKTLKDKTKAELEWLKLKQMKMHDKGEDDKMPSIENRQKGLLKKLEIEQAEIRRLQKVQREASRERRLLLEQHRAISHMESSAKYYHDKLRRHSGRDHFTPSPSHHSVSPVPSEVASQVSEDDIVCPPYSMSYSPSPTPHNTLTLHQHNDDHTQSVAMTTDTANTSTPTIDKRATRELRHHEKYLSEREKILQQRRKKAEETLKQQEMLVKKEQELDEEEKKINSIVSQALHGFQPTTRSHGKAGGIPKKLPLLEATPTQMLATPTTHDSSSNTITEELTHTSSESVPEEVSEEATPTISQKTTEYSNDTFESLPTINSLHTITQTASPSIENDPESTSESLGTTSGGSLEVRISQLRQQLQERRDEVRRARGEQRLRRRALLKEEEDRLKKRLESLDNQLIKLQTNHLPPSPPITTPSTSHLVVHDTSSASQDKELSYTSIISNREEVTSDDVLSQREEGEGSPYDNEEEIEEEIISELSQSVSEDEATHISGHELGQQSGQQSGHELGQQSGQQSGHESEEDIPSEDVKETTPIEDNSTPTKVEATPTDNKTTHTNEQATPTNDEASYTESWPTTDQDSDAALNSIPSTLTNKSHQVSDGLAFSIASSHTSGTAFSIGQRVLVGGVESGTVRFVGATHFKPGLWIGVELDAEKGKNDGCIDGEQYFTCPVGHGVFAPANKLVPLEQEEKEERNEMRPDSTGSSLDEEIEEEGGDSDTISDEMVMPIQQIVERSSTSEHESHDEVVGRRDDEMQGNSIISDELSLTQYSAAVSGQMTEVEGSRDGDSSSPAIPPPLTPPHEEVPITPYLTAPPPDVVKEASEMIVGTQSVPTNVDHMTSDLVQELANEAFHTMHRIWRNKSPSSPTSPTPADHITSSLPRTHRNHHIDLANEKMKRERPDLSKKADRITDQLFAQLLKSETDLVCTLRTNCLITSSEPTSPPRHSSASPLYTPPSLATIQEIYSPPSSPPPSSSLSPSGSPPRHLAPATAARVAAGERSPTIHREPSPPTHLTPSVSCSSLASLVDHDDFTSAHCMVPSTTQQTDMIVENTCNIWHSLIDTTTGRMRPPLPECPDHILSLFSTNKLSNNEQHCQEAYIRLVYDLTLHILSHSYSKQHNDDGDDNDSEVSVWTRYSPSLNSKLVAAQKQTEQKFDLEKVQKRVHGLLVRGQLPSPLPPVKFLNGMKRVGGKDIDFIDSLLIRELRREEASWIDYHSDETTVKLRVADSILDSLLTESIAVMTTIAENKHS